MKTTAEANLHQFIHLEDRDISYEEQPIYEDISNSIERSTESVTHTGMAAATPVQEESQR
ncbi:hypothetical protein ANCCAN_03955 [Ancylostoma caninum]|uniref:Uncharacterized protein n=1 Tax=Ancylostoma caninum TaxID=29170 RepID=A0A368H2S6_ANCCA|nr:hypothetical protein ANCCAN_03955 [Ancylostoma caninum]